ncbi:MAG TPA: hypothetical protein VGF34_09850 [Stellaceae bacterium]|jgi:hypothetical protein
MSEPARRHRLDGLEPDNLLALLGLLRALEVMRPNWRPRAAWDTEEPPLRPALLLSESADRQSICTATVEGLRLFEKALLPFSWPRNKQGKASKTSICTSPERFQALAHRLMGAWIAATDHPNPKTRLIWSMRLELLESGIAETPNAKKTGVEVSPLKLPSGQMSFVGAMFESVKACRVNDISDSLFNPWTFSTRGDSLRLAHQEARRYAYRATDPSPEGARSERGATALGALGLLAFQLVPRGNGAAMLSYQGSRQHGLIFWPIWAVDSGGATYSAIVSLLRALSPDNGKERLKLPAEIVAYMKAARFVLDPRQGDYGNLGRGELNWFNPRR